MSKNLMLASKEWASRAASARFWNLGDLFRHLSNLPPEVEVPTRWDGLVVSVVGDDLRLTTTKGRAEGRDGATFTNHGFNMFCQQVGVPAKFITGVCGNNPTLAAANLNQGISVVGERRADDVEEKDNDAARNRESVVLLTSMGEVPSIRASYSKSYTRVTDAEVCKELMEHGDGWRNPPARPNADDPRSRPATQDDVLECCNAGLPVKVGDMIAPAGIYRDDRSMFAFLVDTTNKIDDGNGGPGLFSGICVKNSETCTERLTVLTFLFEGVCGNHIIWNASGIEVAGFKHRGDDILKKWRPCLREALTRYRQADIGQAADMYAKAKAMMLGADVDAVVKRLGDDKPLGLGKGVLRNAFALAVQYEDTYNAAPNSAWGMIHGLTRLSQQSPNTDARTKIDTGAGKIITRYVMAV